MTVTEKRPGRKVFSLYNLVFCHWFIMNLYMQNRQNSSKKTNVAQHTISGTLLNVSTCTQNTSHSSKTLSATVNPTSISSSTVIRSSNMVSASASSSVLAATQNTSHSLMTMSSNNGNDDDVVEVYPPHTKMARKVSAMYFYALIPNKTDLIIARDQRT